MINSQMSHIVYGLRSINQKPLILLMQSFVHLISQIFSFQCFSCFFFCYTMIVDILSAAVVFQGQNLHRTVVQLAHSVRFDRLPPHQPSEITTGSIVQIIVNLKKIRNKTRKILTFSFWSHFTQSIRVFSFGYLLSQLTSR